ncbi:MAG: YHS domain-containing protein [Armatimonadota bacterium]
MADPLRNQLIDPVCGMHIDPEEAPAVTTYNERSYYFCSDTHKEEFEKNPEHYAAIAEREETGEQAA